MPRFPGPESSNLPLPLLAWWLMPWLRLLWAGDVASPPAPPTPLQKLGERGSLEPGSVSLKGAQLQGSNVHETHSFSGFIPILADLTLTPHTGDFPRSLISNVGYYFCPWHRAPGSLGISCVLRVTMAHLIMPMR